MVQSALLSVGLAALGSGGLGAALGQAAQAPPSSGSAPGSSAASPGDAAKQSSAAAGGPTLQVYSRLTVVDVTVTDNKGQPVHGLKQSDFVIKEDGKAQPIEAFAEVSQDLAAAQRTPPALPPNVYTNAQPPPTTSAVNILLLDTLNTTSSDQVALRQESIKYLKSMPRGTRVAVLGLGTSLRVLQGFTSDPAILIAAVDSKKNRALPSPFDGTDIDDTLNSQIDNTDDDGTVAVLTQFENEQASFQTDMRNRMTLEALNQIAAYVAGIKGRKNLIWFTSGMPLNIFPTGGTNDLQGMTDYSKDLRKTTDLLTAAEVSVYPVDAQALFNNPSLGADQHLGSINKNTGAKVAVAQGAFQKKKGDEQLSMLAVAEATGGVAYFNTNDLKEAVAKAIENGANYYTISYVPPDAAFDGRYHSIDIAVDRPGVQLSYRKGYDADDVAHNQIAPGIPLVAAAPEPYGSNMQASMARGVPPSSQVLFDVRVAPSAQPPKPTDPPLLGELDPRLKGKPLVRYDLEYFFPTRQITFTDASGGPRTASLQFEVDAYDVYGKLLSRLSQKRNLSLTEDQYQQFIRSRPQQFFQQIDLPHGEIFLRVGILDGVSDKVGTLEIPLTVTGKSALKAVPSGGSGGR
ncbi:MAG: VWA domain-containing protein [Acidobacteriaceae bacterium]|jgi:VWFA-related protein